MILHERIVRLVVALEGSDETNYLHARQWIYNAKADDVMFNRILELNEQCRLSRSFYHELCVMIYPQFKKLILISNYQLKDLYNVHAMPIRKYYI